MTGVNAHGEPAEAVSAVARIAAVLDAFDSPHADLGVTEISRRAGLSKSSTSRLVRELVAHGFLDRDGTRLTLGARLAAASPGRAARLRSAALPYMAELRERTGQTIHLAVLDAEAGEVVYLEILRGHDAPRFPSAVGGRLPAHASAVGKVLLAYGGVAALERVFSSGLAVVGPRTITAPGLLRRQLDTIRSAGIAQEYEESGPGVGCLAGPVFGADARPVAALSVSGRGPRVPAGAMRASVLSCTRALSRALQAG